MRGAAVGAAVQALPVPPAQLSTSPSAQLQVSAAALGLSAMDITAHGLRHGRASHDLLLLARSVLGVKGRGRWRSDSMLMRYGKAARALAEFHKAPPPIVEYGRRVAESLDGVFLRAQPLPPVPRLTPG